MANAFLVLAIAFVMQLLLFFTRGEKGDDVAVVCAGVIFIAFTLFKILVFKRDNPGQALTIGYMCGFDDLAKKTQQTAAAANNNNNSAGNSNNSNNKDNSGKRSGNK